MEWVESRDTTQNLQGPEQLPTRHPQLRMLIPHPTTWRAWKTQGALAWSISILSPTPAWLPENSDLLSALHKLFCWVKKCFVYSDEDGTRL